MYIQTSSVPTSIIILPIINMKKKIRYRKYNEIHIGLNEEHRHGDCKYGADCRNFKCKFKHPVVDIVKGKNIMCRFGMKCKRRTCKFAHNTLEYKPIDCIYGDKCQNVGCIYYHIRYVNDIESFPSTIKTEGAHMESHLKFDDVLNEPIKKNDSTIVLSGSISDMVEEYKLFDK